MAVCAIARGELHKSLGRSLNSGLKRMWLFAPTGALEEDIPELSRRYLLLD